MRKFTLMIAFLAFAGFTFAQECVLTKGGPVEKAKANVQASTKAYRDVIWSEDFDGADWSSTVETDGQGYKLDVNATLPDGWTIIDNTNANHFWHWSDIGPRGAYVSGIGPDAYVPRNSLINAFPDGTSADNGFMMLESAYFNTTATSGQMITNPVKMDAIIQYGPVDLTGYPCVMFSIKTIYRYCCDIDAMIGLEISSNYNPDDGTGDWAVYPLNIITEGNFYTYSKERDMHVNISENAANKNNVYFRLHQTKSSHYFWMFDDVEIYEGPNDDLILKEGYADYIYDVSDNTVATNKRFNFWGGYTEIPKNIVGDFVQFRAAVYGNGVNDATDAILTTKVFKDGVMDQTFVSTPKTVWSFSEDTLVVENVDYTPDVGNYQVSMTISMTGDDQNTTDNGWGYSFMVTDTNRYSRVRHGMEDKFNGQGPHDWQNGGNDGDVCVQRFNIPESAGNVAVKSLSVYVSNYKDLSDEITAIENGNFSMIARVYTNDEDGKKIDLGIKSDLYTLVINDTATWVTLNFKEDGNLLLEPGLYWAGIEIYTGNTSLRFEIGSDNFGEKQPTGGGMVYIINKTTWYLTGHNYAIDLYFDFGDGIDEPKTAQNNINNVSVYPNPFNSNLTVNNLGNATQMVISNVLGQTVMTIAVTNNNMVINTDNLEKGVYLITIIDNNNNTTTKRVVKR